MYLDFPIDFPFEWTASAGIDTRVFQINLSRDESKTVVGRSRANRAKPGFDQNPIFVDVRVVRTIRVRPNRSSPFAGHARRPATTAGRRPRGIRRTTGICWCADDSGTTANVDAVNEPENPFHLSSGRINWRRPEVIRRDANGTRKTFLHRAYAAKPARPFAERKV